MNEVNNKENEVQVKKPALPHDEMYLIKPTNQRECYSYNEPIFENGEIKVKDFFYKEVLKMNVSSIEYHGTIKEEISFTFSEGVTIKKVLKSELPWLDIEFEEAKELIREEEIKVLTENNLNLNNTVEMQNQTINSLRQEIDSIKNEAQEIIKSLKEEISALSLNNNYKKNRFDL